MWQDEIETGEMVIDISILMTFNIAPDLLMLQFTQSLDANMTTTKKEKEKKQMEYNMLNASVTYPALQSQNTPEFYC